MGKLIFLDKIKNFTEKIAGNILEVICSELIHNVFIF